MSLDNEHAMKAYPNAPRRRWWRDWSLRRKIMVALLAFISVAALAIGLGVGLSQKRGSDNGQPEQGSGQQSGSGSPTGGTNSTIPSNSTSSSSLWTPSNGTTWQYQLLYPVNDTSPNLEVWDIDLFDNNATQIDSLHNLDRKVICYFSAGSYENWRPDANKFQSSDMGKALDGWRGEKWLNTNSTNVRQIMLSRLDLAVEKRCDGVDPDNVDGYDNDNGLGLTEDDAVAYVNFLADAAHGRNLSLGLKNAGDIVPNVIDKMQWSVQEQCVQYDDCDKFTRFINASKPVFHVEYPKGDSTNNNRAISTSDFNKICNDQDATGFSTLIKNMNLDAWYEACPDTL